MYLIIFYSYQFFVCYSLPVSCAINDERVMTSFRETGTGIYSALVSMLIETTRCLENGRHPAFSKRLKFNLGSYVWSRVAKILM